MLSALFSFSKAFFPFQALQKMYEILILCNVVISYWLKNIKRHYIFHEKVMFSVMFSLKIPASEPLSPLATRVAR